MPTESEIDKMLGFVCGTTRIAIEETLERGGHVHDISESRMIFLHARGQTKYTEYSKEEYPFDYLLSNEVLSFRIARVHIITVYHEGTVDYVRLMYDSKFREQDRGYWKIIEDRYWIE
jgi:hypothetical protein